MKVCTKCEANLDESDYYSHPNTKDGLQSACKSCTKAAARHRYMQKYSYSGNSVWWNDWNRKKEKRQRRKAEKMGASKTCKRCGESKPATSENFYTGAGRHGLKSYCKPCDNALKSERRRAKKEAKQ